MAITYTLYMGIGHWAAETAVEQTRPEIAQAAVK
jgi:hypothetical protein